MSNTLPKRNNNSFVTTLADVAIGETCVIADCSLNNTVKLRLEEMGLTKGARVTVVKTAPLGDPMQICVRGYALCLRKETAKAFTVRRTQ